MSKKTDTPNVLDLSKYDTAELANNGAPMTLSDPVTGLDFVGNDGKPVVITVIGQDSDVWRQKNYEILNKRLQNPKLRNMAPRMDVVEAENIERLVVSIVGWTDNFSMGGAPIPFSPDNARMLLQRFSWFREQVVLFQENVGNFLSK